MSDDWCAELDSALDFLAGERGQHPDDFVPYLQYLPETQVLESLKQHIRFYILCNFIILGTSIGFKVCLYVC